MQTNKLGDKNPDCGIKSQDIVGKWPMMAYIIRKLVKTGQNDHT